MLVEERSCCVHQGKSRFIFIFLQIFFTARTGWLALSVVAVTRRRWWTPVAVAKNKFFLLFAVRTSWQLLAGCRRDVAVAPGATGGGDGVVPFFFSFLLGASWHACMMANCGTIPQMVAPRSWEEAGAVVVAGGGRDCRGGRDWWWP